MPRLIALCLCFHSGLALATSALRETYRQLNCSEFLTGKPPVHPGKAPSLPSVWKTIGKLLNDDYGAIREHKAQKIAVLKHAEATERYNDQIMKIAVERERGQTVLNKFFADPEFRAELDADYLRTAQVLAEQAQTLLAQSVTSEQNSRIVTSILVHGINLRTESRTARAERARINAQRELERRSRELRFDLNKVGVESKIIDQFAKLIPKPLGEVRADLASKLRLEPALKIFVANEIQVVRRLNRIADKSTLNQQDLVRNIIWLRLKNDLAVLNAESADIATLNQIRLALVSLINSKLFTGLGPSITFRRLNYLEREEVVQDALNKEDFRQTLLRASADISAPKLPAPPIAPSPTPPSPYKPPRKVSSQSQLRDVKRKVEAYRKQITDWKMAWENFKSARTAFTEKLYPEYQVRFAQYRVSYFQRQSARRSFLTYLSFFKPNVFTQVETARAFAAQNRLAIERKLESRSDGMSREQVREREARNSDQDDIQFNWFLFQYYMYLSSNSNADMARTALASEAYRYSGSQPDPSSNSTLVVPDSSAGNLNPPTFDLLSPDPLGPLGSFVGPDSPLPGPDASQFSINPADHAQIPSIDFPTFADAGAFTMPDVQMPDVQMPDVQMPDIQIPDIQIPDVQMPDIQMPDIQMPDMSSTSIDTSFSPPDMGN